MDINPIRQPAASSINQASRPAQKDVVAKKVSQIGLPKLPQRGGLANREMVLLKETSELSKYIQMDWDSLDPAELAKMIIVLKDRVALFSGVSPAIEKIKKEADRLHFQFVFPVVLELDKNSASPSFAKTIHNLADKILKQGSVEPFSLLNQRQMQEVRRLSAP